MENHVSVNRIADVPDGKTTMILRTDMRELQDWAATVCVSVNQLLGRPPPSRSDAVTAIEAAGRSSEDPSTPATTAPAFSTKFRLVDMAVTVSMFSLEASRDARFILTAALTADDLHPTNASPPAAAEQSAITAPSTRDRIFRKRGRFYEVLKKSLNDAFAVVMS